MPGGPKRSNTDYMCNMWKNRWISPSRRLQPTVASYDVPELEEWAAGNTDAAMQIENSSPIPSECRHLSG